MAKSTNIIYTFASLSTALLGTLFFYYVWKRSRDEDDDETYDDDTEELEFADLNAAEENVASAGQTIVGVMVPQHVVGVIIGKDGASIKQLRSEFGVRFNFEREELNEENGIGGRSEIGGSKRGERVLEIRGQRDKVRLAEYKIKAMIADTPKYVETEMFVPAETCGRIIGKGGQNIREMSSTSGAKITLEREEAKAPTNQQRRIRLSGTTVQIDYAKLMIKEKVEQALVDTKKYKRKVDDGGKKPPNLRHIDLPSTGEYFQVFVSSARSPTDFWVQLVSQEAAKLDRLIDELAEVYGELKPEEERLESGKVGDLCIAPFDGGMYRAIIEKINNDRSADVLYVDYGDVATVDLDDMKEMRFEYRDMYGQAAHCKLQVDPVPISVAGGEWSAESCELFTELTRCAQWKPIMAKVLEVANTPKGDVYTLKLVDTSQDHDVNVAANLVSKALAITRKGV